LFFDYTGVHIHNNRPVLLQLLAATTIVSFVCSFVFFPLGDRVAVVIKLHLGVIITFGPQKVGWQLFSLKISLFHARLSNGTLIYMFEGCMKTQ
jgi:hypothetical protein